MNSLDLTLLPSITSVPLFWSVPDALRQVLQPHGETLKRCEGAHFFCLRSTADDALSNAHRDCYVRAALAEYAAMGDMAKIEANYEWFRSNSPLLHFVRLLRHVNIHIESSRLSETSTSAVWPTPEQEIQMTLRVWSIERSSLEQVKNLRANIVSNYVSGDLDRIINWFDSTQRTWGAADLFRRAVASLGAEIAGTPSPVST